MIRENKSIGELTAEIEAAFSRLRNLALPAGLEALRYLAPPHGLAPSVQLQYSDGRKIKRTADAGYWDAQRCQAVVSFELEEDDFAETGAKVVDENTNDNSVSSRLGDLILALDAAERDKRFAGFVGLKSFRDQFLDGRGLSWAADREARHYALAKAINDELILKTSIPNPNRPDFPTTAVKLNREHSIVKDVLKKSEPDRAIFNPVKIHGKPLSSTIIEERR